VRALGEKGKKERIYLRPARSEKNTSLFGARERADRCQNTLAERKYGWKSQARGLRRVELPFLVLKKVSGPSLRPGTGYPQLGEEEL